MGGVGDRTSMGNTGAEPGSAPGVSAVSPDVTRVIVTGGAGFIGSHVVDAYVEAGLQVSVVDNLTSGSVSNLNPAARLYEVDIRDGAALERVFAEVRPQLVSHQAAQASVKLSMEDPPRDAMINVIGSLNVLEACRKTGVRKLIYAATGGAAVGEPVYLPVDEDHPVNPLSPYGADKHAVEHYCVLYQQSFGLDTTILRYSNIYGPRQDPRGEAGVIAIFAGMMLAGGQPVIYGSGEQERDYVYVGDVARANVLALNKGAGRMYNIGTGVSTSVNGLSEFTSSSVVRAKLSSRFLISFGNASSPQNPNGPKSKPPFSSSCILKSSVGVKPLC